MALTVYRRDKDHNHTVEHIEYDGFAYEWICENLDSGQNFGVYIGEICDKNDISRTDEMKTAKDVSIVILPAGGVLVAAIVAIVVATAVTLLIPTPDVPSNVNRAQESPNNQLTDRRNRFRVNQRIPDIVGEVFSVPDAVAQEYSRYVNGIEERVGVYVVGRNQLLIENLKDGDTIITATDQNQGARVFYPYASPNKGDAPSQVFGAFPPLDRIKGVFTDKNAVNQTLIPPEVRTINLSTSSGFVGVDKALSFGYLIDPNITLSEYPIGSRIDFSDLYIEQNPTGGPPYNYTNLNSNGQHLEVTGNAFGRLEFSIDDNPEWFDIVDDNTDYPVLGVTYTQSGQGAPIPTTRLPQLKSPEVFSGRTYKITSTKVDELIFNFYAPNGLYRRNNNGDYEATSVEVSLNYYLLDDSFNRIGQLQTVELTLTDNTLADIGDTINVSLGADYYIEWYVARVTVSEEYNGTIVDSIKLKSAFGLYDVGNIDFGNVTLIQTKRTSLPESAGVTSPELNCTATEMINKYLGGGSFDPAKTKNTQAMQSLIAQSIDPKIGRLSINDVDADLLLSVQSEIETYFGNAKAGRCCYTFDSTGMSSQDAFMLIANSVNTILWREGRVLKGWFESPQSFPEMVFTHRSKAPNRETWNRTFNTEFDGVEFKYTDEKSGQQEVLFYPESPSNPKSFEIPGIKGVELATWRMMREYNKLQLQRETVDFTATAEGRFVRPAKLIGVVKDSRVGSYAGYVRGQSGLVVELSQDVEFSTGDDHFILFKNRNGSVESVQCTESTQGKRFVNLNFAPIEPLYYGNDELKTEFSFGNEALLASQLMMPQEIDSSEKYYTNIKAINYNAGYYDGDPTQPIGRAFSDGFSNGFS